jgi:hypothetical protein
MGSFGKGIVQDVPGAARNQVGFDNSKLSTKSAE